jgi:hypothetical protein
VALLTAIVDRNGKARQLTKSAQPDEEVTKESLAEVSYLPRTLMRILKDIATLKRQWMPRRIDFEDVVVTASGKNFVHNFNTRVRWWAVDATGSVAALVRSASSTDNILVLTATVGSPTVTIRIEEAG